LERPDVVVVGAGAAGLVAAIFAARGGARVLLLERTADGGRKILISGGGRCNVLPSRLAAERFVTDSAPRLLRGLLRSWPLAQQREFFERDLAVPLALEEDTGKLFPATNRARDVRDSLVQHARALGVVFRFGTTVTGFAPREADWVVHSAHNSDHCRTLIVATGGLSVPATGSDGAGLRVVEGLGHLVHALYPALTPLVSQPPVHAALSGVSLEVRLRARAGASFDGKVTESSGGFLFTHRGYSGPAVLDVSHVAVRHRDAVIRAQWSPVNAPAWDELLTKSAGLVQTVLALHVPHRLAATLMAECQVPADRRVHDLRRVERVRLIDALTSYVLPWTGDEGFKKAEVTGGGVALEEIDPATLESRRCRGLFLCGEMLDAFGPIGGHNFAWAWATGRLAGRAAAQHSS
jgi:predicted Rossmann fold flavoprotein